MKIKVAIQRVQSLYSKGVQSDDSRLSARHIYSIILSMRSTLLTQKANKRQPISQWSYQTLKCVELVEAPPYECPCLPAIGCVILKSKYPLPQPLTGLMEGHMLQSVTSLEGSVTFSATTWKDKKYKSGSKYTSTKPDYFIRDNHIYITSKKGPKAITLTGLFEDPLEAFDFPSMCDTPCEDKSTSSECFECISPLERDLPFEKDMERTLIELSAHELSTFISKGREDRRNDGRDPEQRQQQEIEQ